MVEFSFLLSDNDTELLYEQKKRENLDSLTGNEYAAELLRDILHYKARNDLDHREPQQRTTSSR